MTEALSAEELARRFHETYERLAPSFGYETRRASAVPWEDVPENNRRLMVAVAWAVLATLDATPAPPDGLREAARALIAAEDAIEAFEERAAASYASTGWGIPSEEADPLVAAQVNALAALRAALARLTPDDVR